jgi:glycosyl transferase, family 25
MLGFSTYVINLESRKDRRAAMETQLRRIKWDAQFFPAVRPPHAGDFASIGARGCFLSHLAVLKRAALQNDHAVIMEDDLNFSRDFSSVWPATFSALQSSDWSIFYPAHVLPDQPKGLSLLAPSQRVLCTHFMVIHKNVIATLIDGLETILSRPGGHPMGGPMHVDGAYSTLRSQNPELHTYVFSPSMGYQRPSRSDIVAPAVFDRILLLRPAVSALRKLKLIVRSE